jgi:hypothetical protein
MSKRLGEDGQIEYSFLETLEINTCEFTFRPPLGVCTYVFVLFLNYSHLGEGSYWIMGTRDLVSCWTIDSRLEEMDPRSKSLVKSGYFIVYWNFLEIIK